MLSASRVPLRQFLDSAFEGQSTSTAFLRGFYLGLGLYFIGVTLHSGRLLRRVKLSIFRAVRVLAKPIVEKEIAKAAAAIKFAVNRNVPKHDALPAQSTAYDEVLKQMEELKTIDDDYHEGKLSGTVYHGGDDYTTFINRAMELYQWTNPLHIDSFPSVRQMESEIVSMAVHMYNGSPKEGMCGSVTTGGTESIMMAMKVYRDRARVERGITKPNVVMPITAHPAFDKACNFFQIELYKVPVSSITGRVDLAELEEYINCNTIAIVGSAPNYPYGTVDPIGDLASLAKRRGIGMHVDACLGSFVVPFLEKAGAVGAPVVDFRHEGVTTISADTHKFGYGPKGTSVVLYRNPDLRRYQYFSVGNWPGGLYASPSAPGSKPGNAIAGTWAAMMAHGEGGYVAAAKEIQRNLWKIRDGLNDIPEIYVLGNPSVCSCAFTSDFFDIYELSERINLEGWSLNALQFPSGICFSLTLVHTRGSIADDFLDAVRRHAADLVAERREALKNGTAKPIGAQGGTLYGGQQKVADRSILEDVTKRVFDVYYEVSPPAKTGRETAL